MEKTRSRWDASVSVLSITSGKDEDQLKTQPAVFFTRWGDDLKTRTLTRPHTRASTLGSSELNEIARFINAPR